MSLKYPFSSHKEETDIHPPKFIPKSISEISFGKKFARQVFKNGLKSGFSVKGKIKFKSSAMWRHIHAKALHFSLWGFL